jgi:uncharacterized membrane protein (DUF106 family)
MPAREGMYFYLIIGVSVLLPIVIAVCVFFTDIVVTALITAFLLSILGFLIYGYLKMRKQFREFEEAIDKLEFLEGDHEISMLGGLIQFRIEEGVKRLPPGGMTIEEKHDD